MPCVKASPLTPKALTRFREEHVKTVVIHRLALPWKNGTLPGAGAQEVLRMLHKEFTGEPIRLDAKEVAQLYRTLRKEFQTLPSYQAKHTWLRGNVLRFLSATCQVAGSLVIE